MRLFRYPGCVFYSLRLLWLDAPRFWRRIRYTRARDLYNRRFGEKGLKTISDLLFSRSAGDRRLTAQTAFLLGALLYRLLSRVRGSQVILLSCSLAPARPFTSFGTRVCSEQLLQDMTHAIIVPIDYPIFVLHLHQIVTPAIIVPYLIPDILAITVPLSIHLYLCSIYAKTKGVNFLTPSFCFTWNTSQLTFPQSQCWPFQQVPSCRQSW